MDRIVLLSVLTLVFILSFNIQWSEAVYESDIDPDSFQKLHQRYPALVLLYQPNDVRSQTTLSFFEGANTLHTQSLLSHKVLIATWNVEQYQSLSSYLNSEKYPIPSVVWIPKGRTKPEDVENIGPARGSAKLIEYIRSRLALTVEIPKDKEVSSVVSLNALNFDDLVIDSKDSSGNDVKRSVLVEFYAPWCGHCKKLAPKYKELASLYEGEDEIMIADINADEEMNKVISNRYGIRGFPTILLFKYNNKQNPIKYEVPRREVSDFVQFLIDEQVSDITNTGDVNEIGGIHPELTFQLVDYVKNGFNDKQKSELTKNFEVKLTQTGKNEKSIAYYHKLIDKLATKGREFITNEASRLEKLISSDTIQMIQKRSAQRRLNILRSIKDEL